MEIDKKTFDSIGREVANIRHNGLNHSDVADIMLNNLIDTCNLADNIKELAGDYKDLANIKHIITQHMDIMNDKRGVFAYLFCERLTSLFITAMEIQNTYELSIILKRLREGE